VPPGPMKIAGEKHVIFAPDVMKLLTNRKSSIFTATRVEAEGMVPAKMVSLQARWLV